MSELIAEARVLVTPDTTNFRALLTAQVDAAAQGVTVPVTVTPVVTSAVSASSATVSRDLLASQTALASTEERLAGATAARASSASRATEAARLEAIAARQLAVAQEEVLGTTTALGTAQTRAARAAAALATARRAESLVTRQTNAETVNAIAFTLQLAEAENVQATAAVRSAKAEAERAAALAQSSRGAASAGLSFAGLRGATLAAGGAFLAGAAGLTSLVRSLGQAAQFETSLNTFRVTAGATADEMERISEVSRQLGSDLTLPGVTANSAADALSQLSRAGLSVQDSIDGVRGTLQLATAAAIDNEAAVQLTASALNAFRLSGDQAGRVADLLAAASNESQGSIEDVGLALQQSAAAAAQAGVSLEDTVALLTELGRAGLRGSDAGTSLRVALLRLINPSKQAKDALDGLGVAIRDEQGNVRPEAFSEITEALSRFTKAQQDATLALIFGQDAFRAAAIIGREGGAGLNELREATQKAGVAAELAAARTQGLSGSIENANNQFGALGLTIGSALNEPAQATVDLFANIASSANAALGFLGSLGDSAETTGDQFAALSDELNVTIDDFADLAVEAGKANAALFGDAANDPAAINRAKELTKALEDSAPAALKTADAIEDLRAGLAASATAAEGLRNRLDEAFDRAAHAPKEPVLPVTGPTPIGPTARLDVAVAIAQSNNDLQEVLRLQEIRLDNARKAFQNSRGNVRQRTALFEAMGAAEAAVNQTRRQIAQQEANEAETARRERERIAEQAKRARDQEFLDAQEDARTAAQRLVSRAQDTEGLQDDIRRQQQFRALLVRQIAAIKASALDEQAKQQALRTLRQARDATTDEIQRLVSTDREQRQAAREQAQEEREAAQIALGESILELTGNRNPLLRALDAAIKDAIAERNKAKKGSVEFLKAQTEINNLLARKKEINKQIAESADDTTGGTSLADLFQQAERIASGAGNVGGLNAFNVRAQPRIQAEVQERLDIVSDPAKAAAARQAASTDRLIQAIDQLTAAITGNSATGVPLVPGGQNRRGFARNLSAEQRFYNQRVARQMVEQGLVG